MGNERAKVGFWEAKKVKTFRGKRKTGETGSESGHEIGHHVGTGNMDSGCVGISRHQEELGEPLQPSSESHSKANLEQYWDHQPQATHRHQRT